jgi:hypothetical protein
VAWPDDLSDGVIYNALYSLLGRTALIESSVNLIQKCAKADANGDANATA